MSALRLTGSSSQEPPPSGLELVVRDPATGRELLSLLLRIPPSGGPVAPMGSTAAAPAAHGGAEGSTEPIAGRIDASATDLREAVDAWIETLRRRGKRPRTLVTFREVVMKAAGDCGWAHRTQLTNQAIVEWLSGHLADATWKAPTYNRNLCVFRSLTKFLHRSGRITADPLAAESNIEAMGGPGARAATTDEARSLLRVALSREAIDRRVARGTTLQLLCMFKAACRVSEPGKWRRRHLVLTHSTPHVHWTADINKNKKEQWIALDPELAEQLQLHLARQDAERRDDGRAPAGPDEHVFPEALQDQTFKLYAAAAGIQTHDWRGRKFSPHAAPKWFCTTLGQLAEQKMVDHLKRHTGSVPARYFDPSLEDQAAALAKLPPLWPEDERIQPAPAPAAPAPSRIPDGDRPASPGQGKPESRGSEQRVDKVENPGPDLTRGRNVADDVLTAAASSRRPRGRDYEAENRHSHLHNPDRDAEMAAIADLLEAAARLLRLRSSSRGPGTPGHQPPRAG